MTLKDLVREKIDEYKKVQKVRKGYESILKKKIELAKRQAFAKEAVRQAKITAKENAKVRFSKPKQNSGLGNLGNAQQGLQNSINFGVPKQKDNKKKFDPIWDY